MTEDRLEELEKIITAATEQPWVKRPYGGVNPEFPTETDGFRCIARPRPDLVDEYPKNRYGEAFREELVCSGWNMKPQDVDFICTAREAMPELVEEVMKLQAALYTIGEELRKNGPDLNFIVQTVRIAL
jgi:hypothetical protein